MAAARHVWAYIRLGRCHFLVGGFVLHGLGVAAALYTGAPLNWQALLWGQLAITAIQLMTHYANEYFDLEADRANPTPTRWSGGSRILPSNTLSPQVALISALGLALLAVIAILILTLFVRPGLLTPGLLLLSLLLAWGYSAPPLQLHSRGVGEFTTAVLVPGLTPIVGFYLQTGTITALPLLTVIPLSCLQFAMLLAIEFPDEAGDRAAGKRTLVVRLGGAKAARLWMAALLLPYAVAPLLVLAGLPLPVGIASMVSAPIALWMVWRVGRGAWANPTQWNSLAFWSIALFMGTAALELAAFLGLIANVFP